MSKRIASVLKFEVSFTPDASAQTPTPITDLGFTEISGIAAGQSTLPYREGKDPSLVPSPHPSMQQPGTITMKRGVCTAVSGEGHDNNDILAALKSGITEGTRGTLIIQLKDAYDKAGTVIREWTLSEALPTKYTGPDLNAMNDALAVETFEFQYRGMQVKVVGEESLDLGYMVAPAPN